MFVRAESTSTNAEVEYHWTPFAEWELDINIGNHYTYTFKISSTVVLFDVLGI